VKRPFTLVAAIACAVAAPGAARAQGTPLTDVEPPPSAPAQEAPGPSSPAAQPAAPASAAPTSPPAATAPPASASPRQTGLAFSADIGGGGRIGAGSGYGGAGLFEIELTAGYELFPGARPEVSVLLGVAPDAHTGLRLGIHLALPDLPFYLRGAVDGATENGTAWRWLLGGGGIETRLTDVLAGFAEADLGIPLTSGAGVPILIRAGVTFRL